MASRKAESRRAAELKTVRAAAKTLGIDFEELLKTMPLTSFGTAAIERNSIEAESVLYYIKTKGKDFTMKSCLWCEDEFLSTYRAVAYCSDPCRAFALEEKGIDWNPQGKEDSDRWNITGKGFVPKVIGVAATGVLNDAERAFDDA